MHTGASYGGGVRRQLLKQALQRIAAAPGPGGHLVPDGYVVQGRDQRGSLLVVELGRRGCPPVQRHPPAGQAPVPDPLDPLPVHGPTELGPGTLEPLRGSRAGQEGRWREQPFELLPAGQHGATGQRRLGREQPHRAGGLTGLDRCACRRAALLLRTEVGPEAAPADQHRLGHRQRGEAGQQCLDQVGPRSWRWVIGQHDQRHPGRVLVPHPGEDLTHQLRLLLYRRQVIAHRQPQPATRLVQAQHHQALGRLEAEPVRQGRDQLCRAGEPGDRLRHAPSVLRSDSPQGPPGTSVENSSVDRCPHGPPR